MTDKTRMYEDVREMVDNEVEAILKKGTLDEKSLMCLDKLVDIRKDVCEIISRGEYENMSSRSGGGQYSYRSRPDADRMYRDRYYDSDPAYRGNGYYRSDMM